MKIVHVITRLILGGAQENTLLTVEGLHHRFKDEVVLIAGPAEGPEGDLFEKARRSGFGSKSCPNSFGRFAQGATPKRIVPCARRFDA